MNGQSKFSDIKLKKNMSSITESADGYEDANMVSNDDNLPPWESKDPNVRKFFEDSNENRILD